MGGITFYNCRNGLSINVRKGLIVEEEQSERIDCKEARVVPLKCTLAVNPARSLEELIEHPEPPERFLDSLILGGVGLAIVPKKRKSPLPQVETKFIMDPMTPPEELPDEKAVVQRSVTPESSYGYKRKFGEWPIRHASEKLKNKIVLNPFWVTTWETRLIELPAFVTEMGPRWGISSPIPLELLEAIYSPYTPCTGPVFASFLAELIAKSHYWNEGARAKHLDEACWRFAGEEVPSFRYGSKARFAIVSNTIQYYVNGELVLGPDELIELGLGCSFTAL
ncbi:hypothetical protein EYM_01665 [Ignicoccus islandicus DSM 13165]|uniref:Uncharacterized protein n=1 Tax=Ignicoccus islandicus DSM 13165 TaxID=940295 RepID=A0A0U3FK20_9CREN|nr:hypothetical protein [Ignicoccus islandicus]ALU12230.1 hypothetical protein EYM_01665 [Ignicoccus islandicus DSM 13165]